MRTGLEITARPVDISELDEQLRLTGAALVDALREMPTPDQCSFAGVLLQDVRWNISEALRLNTILRRRLADPPGSATPGQSHHASLHDPPDACQPGKAPP